MMVSMMGIDLVFLKAMQMVVQKGTRLVDWSEFEMVEKMVAQTVEMWKVLKLVMNLVDLMD